MFFYSDGINTWTITHGNKSEDITKRQTPVEQYTHDHNGKLYTVEKFDIGPDLLVIPPDEEWFDITKQWVEPNENWVDQAGQWVDGYKQWAEDQAKFETAEDLMKYLDSMMPILPKPGEQLEFDFIRQMEI